MKNALTVMSWIAVIMGVLALISGVTEVAVDPQSAYYSLLGGALFAIEGGLALTYINEHK